MTREQIAGRAGPVRQTRYRDEIVSPLSLERSCRELLQRVQYAIATIINADVYQSNLSATMRGPILRQHEWEIAVALREISELLLELATGFAAGGAGPMTTAVLASQNRAITMARDAITARVVALEGLAGHVAVAEAARRDWETAQRLAARNDKYLDLLARTAADEHATTELTSLAGQAAAAGQVFRETLAQAVLSAETLALPGGH